MQMVISADMAGIATACGSEFSELGLPVVRDLQIESYQSLSGLSFLVVDPKTLECVGECGGPLVPYLSNSVRKRLTSIDQPMVITTSAKLAYYAIPGQSNRSGKPQAIGVGYVRTSPDVDPPELRENALRRGWSDEQYETWLDALPVMSGEMLSRMFQITIAAHRAHRQNRKMSTELTTLTARIEYVFEEISLLHNLTKNLQVSRPPQEIARLCLAQMHELIGAEGSFIWLDIRDGDACFSGEGEFELDEMSLARLVAKFESHDWRRPLVKNHFQRRHPENDFPDIESFIMVPIAQGVHRAGWIISCNIKHGREFGTVEASLINTVATILGTHLHNIDLYRQQEELLLSFVRSLVSTLDAKDPYTRGHSERVALISRRLGKELGLDRAELDAIYLAGLLHDIGKIGVDDRILRKPGALSDEEFAKIQQHPEIGYGILTGISQLQDVLPAVRNHHESYRGGGYPDGLSGEDIPFVARILAVADAYDAMGSDRPYRRGLPVEKLNDILRRGGGEQWDPKVIDAYFRVEQDIRRICDTYSRNGGKFLSLRQDTCSEIDVVN